MMIRKNISVENMMIMLNFWISDCEKEAKTKPPKSAVQYHLIQNGVEIIKYCLSCYRNGKDTKIKDILKRMN